VLRQKQIADNYRSSYSWCSADGVIRAHETSAAEVQKMMSRGFQFPASSIFSQQSKAAAPGPPKELERCSPLAIKSLQLNNTQRGGVLRGTLAVDPFVMSAIHTVLVDDSGDALKVG
jgi:hypothetical protein